MKKRGQISVFLIIGIILIIGGIFYYIKVYNAKDAIGNSPRKMESEAGIVKAYVESCIKNVAEEALFEKIGEQGGYIDVNANQRYGEAGSAGSPINPPYTSFQGKSVPYYLEAECDKYCYEEECTCSPIGCTPPPLADCQLANRKCAKWKCRKWSIKENIPDIDVISKKLANYIAVEFEDCFKKNIFEGMGMKIEKPNVNYRAVNFDFSRTNVNVNVSANKEDVSVYLRYPLIITQGNTKTNLDSFLVVLPIRLKALHDSSSDLINNIIAKLSNDAAYRDTDFLTNVPYSLSVNECASFDKNRLTNVYSKSASPSEKIIQFTDFSTYQKYYVNSYIFQFAVKNIDVQGNCVR